MDDIFESNRTSVPPNLAVQVDYQPVHARMIEIRDYVPVQEIHRIASPSPEDWYLGEEREITLDLGQFDEAEIKRIEAGFNVASGGFLKRTITKRMMVKTHVVPPGEFVWVQSGGQEIALRWSTVSSFKPIRTEDQP